MQLVVGHRVQHFGVCPAAVVPVDDLAQEEKVPLSAVRKAAQRRHEAKVQHIRCIQANAVDVEFRDPEVYGVQKMLPHFGIALVQLHQQVIAAPVFVGKPIVEAVVPVKAHIAEPIPVPGIFPVFQQVPECEKVPAHMVENSVQHHPDGLFVAVRHKVLQVLICAQTAVQRKIIRGLIAMAHGLKQRANIQGIAAQVPDMVHPGPKGAQTGLRRAIVVLFRGSGEAQGINMVKNSFLIPGHYASSPKVCSSGSYFRP